MADILDTRGVYTVTIYPESSSSNDLAEDVSIGVRWSSGCRKIYWCKGRKRTANFGPRLILKSTEDAGLYTIRQPRRARRGWFVHILVIGATCPKGDIYNPVNAACEGGYVCLNGEVFKNVEDACICPPFLDGTTCQCAKDNGGTDLILADMLDKPLLCKDLPGGDPKCKGHLVCYGDNYGCKCAPEWWGNACDRACPKGKWGANCEQNCPLMKLVAIGFVALLKAGLTVIHQYGGENHIPVSF
ncbi:uncharacterized protein [Apostichopus japonicus]|uniref:uncharacterized protein n=1 Tax=Stichopus japonicus TaxID=307972 RepID=UPI003AB21A6E